MLLVMIILNALVHIYLYALMPTCSFIYNSNFNITFIYFPKLSLTYSPAECAEKGKFPTKYSDSTLFSIYMQAVSHVSSQC